MSTRTAIQFCLGARVVGAKDCALLKPAIPSIIFWMTGEALEQPSKGRSGKSGGRVAGLERRTMPEETRRKQESNERAAEVVDVRTRGLATNPCRCTLDDTPDTPRCYSQGAKNHHRLAFIGGWPDPPLVDAPLQHCAGSTLVDPWCELKGQLYIRERW